jgi:hypothetical protein
VREAEIAMAAARGKVGASRAPCTHSLAIFSPIVHREHSLLSSSSVLKVIQIQCFFVWTYKEFITRDQIQKVV